MEELKICAAGALLALCSIQDIKNKKIYIGLPVAFFALGLIVRIAERNLMTAIAGMLPGAILIMLSFISRGQIGTGDGLVLLALGILEGWEQALFCLAGGMLLCFPVSVFWYVIRDEKRKEIPFIPFLAGGFLCQIIFAGM